MDNLSTFEIIGLFDQFINEQGMYEKFLAWAQEEGYDIDDDSYNEYMELISAE